MNNEPVYISKLLTQYTEYLLKMSNAPGGYDGSPTGVDLNTYPAAAKLVQRVGEFMKEVQNLYVDGPKDLMKCSLQTLIACKDTGKRS